jgi:hypothetical protein
MLLTMDDLEQKQKILAVILCMELYYKKEAYDGTPYLAMGKGAVAVTGTHIGTRGLDTEAN